MLKYIIKNTADVTPELYEASLFTEENVRKSNDGTKVILKFEGDVGNLLDGETVYDTSHDLFETEGYTEWV